MSVPQLREALDMKAKLCNVCGNLIRFAVSTNGRTVALDDLPEARYVFRWDDSVERKVEYRCVYRAHQETCGKTRHVFPQKDSAQDGSTPSGQGHMNVEGQRT